MEVSAMQANGGRSVQSDIELRCFTWAVIFCIEHINIPRKDSVQSVKKQRKILKMGIDFR